MPGAGCDLRDWAYDLPSNVMCQIIHLNGCEDDSEVYVSIYIMCSNASIALSERTCKSASFECHALMVSMSVLDFSIMLLLLR